MDKKIKELLDKKNLTLEEKTYINAVSAEMGLKFNPVNSCENCYFDQLILIYNKLIFDKNLNGKRKQKYILKQNADFIINGKRINSSNLVPEIVENLPLNIVKIYFHKHPKL